MNKISVLNNFQQFIDKVLDECGKHGLDVSLLSMDHIAYQAGSDKEYYELKDDFNNIATFVEEEIVSGRKVAIYRLKKQLQYKAYTISALELISPLENQFCNSGLEHLEFILTDSFESFINQYPGVPWDASAVKRERFPILKLRLDDNTQVKFRLGPILDYMGNV